MAKSISTLTKDALLNYIKDNVSQLCVCNAEPTTRTEAITTYNIASITITSTDITLSASGSNRVATIAEQDLTFSGSDTGTHVALISIDDLLAVTTITSTLIENDFTVSEYDITVVDP